MSTKSKLNPRAPRTAGSVGEVASVGWPIVIAMLSYTAMDVADTLFVGWMGKTELAAVGVATIVVFLFNSFFVGVLHGTKVVCAQFHGARRRADADAAGWAGGMVALPLGLMVALTVFAADPIFRLMGGSDQVQALAKEYFSARVLGAAAIYILIALSDYFQGTGDTRTPMKVNLIANAANIVLDPILIFGWWVFPAMGVQGAAVATVSSQVLGMLMVGWLFVRRAGWLRTIPWQHAGEMLRLGLPIGVRAVLGVAAFAGFTAFLARMGEGELAAHQIALKIVSISFLPGFGLSETATILTGQYLGAGRFAEIRKSYQSTLILALGIMGACGILFFGFGPHLVRLFNSDPYVVELGSKLLMVAALFQIFDALAMVSVGALNGVGDTRFTMFGGIACSWLVLLPSSYLFGVVLDGGAVGAWFGMTAEIAAMSALMTWRFVNNGWRSRATVRLAPAAAE